MVPHDAPASLLRALHGRWWGATMSDFLERLGVGDRVIVEGRNGGSVAEVTHATPTQIHIGGSKYRRKDGREIGADMWYGRDLSEATPAAVANIRETNKRDRLIRDIRDAVDSNRLYNATTPELEAMHAALLPAKKP